MAFKNFKIIFILILALVSASQISAQDLFYLPKNLKPGKCFVNCFDYDKPFEWQEIDCKKLQDNQKSTAEILIKKKQNEIKMTKYQEKLQSLGYDVDVTGHLDYKTNTAHNAYLKQKKKDARKAKKKARKAEKKQNKESNK